MTSVLAAVRRAHCGLQKLSKPSYRCIRIKSYGYGIIIRYRAFSATPRTDGNSLLDDVKSKPTDDQKMESIMHQIRNLDPFAIDNKLALASCQYVLRYHEQKLRKAAEAKMAHTDALKKEQRGDLQFGYILLQNMLEDTAHTQQKLMSSTLKTEVARKLRDGGLLSESFEEMLEHEAEFTEQHMMIAFGTCCFLGDWPRMVRYGELLEKRHTDRDGNDTGKMPSEFAAVYDLVKGKYALHQSNARMERQKSLQWQTWRVLNIRIRLSEIDCEEWKEKQKEAMAEIVGESNTDHEWEDVKDSGYPDLNKQGAIWQIGSFCQNSITLCGPHFQDKIHVIGKEEYLDERKRYVWTMTEELNLVQNENADKLFTGTYRLSQTAALPDNVERTMETAPVHMHWDCELYLGEEIEAY